MNWIKFLEYLGYMILMAVGFGVITGTIVRKIGISSHNLYYIIAIITIIGGVIVVNFGNILYGYFPF